MESRLSIVILTMNRAKQLISALESCLVCTLPHDTIIVVVDNASTDNTEEELLKFFGSHVNGNYIYKKMGHNTGAGGGRSIGFNLTETEYVFFLDDDAVVDKDNADIFFTKALSIMDDNPSIATLTTKIYDEMLQANRTVRCAKSNLPGKVRSIAMIHGGSCFFRRSAFGEVIYPEIIYGFEEFYPSFLAVDNNYVNAYEDTLNVIHRPLMDKWIKDSHLRTDNIIVSYVGLLTVKSLLYPSIFHPLLHAAFAARWFKYLRKEKGSFKKSYQLYSDLRQENILLVKKIKIRTVLKIFKDFGFGAGV